MFLYIEWVGLNILLSVSGNRIHQDEEMSLASDHIQEDLIHHDGKQGTFNVKVALNSCLD